MDINIFNEAKMTILSTIKSCFTGKVSTPTHSQQETSQKLKSAQPVPPTKVRSKPAGVSAAVPSSLRGRVKTFFTVTLPHPYRMIKSFPYDYRLEHGGM